MVKIMCDKCGIILESEDYYTFDIYGETKPRDFCKKCYNEFNLWVNNRADFVVKPLFKET